MDKRRGTSWRSMVSLVVGVVVSRGIAARAHQRMARTLRSGGVAVALALVLASGTLGQVAGLPQAFAQGSSSSPHVTHTPNTLSRFRTTGNAWGNKPGGSGATVPLQGEPVYHGVGPSKAPASVGASLAKPVVVPLDSGLIAGDTASTGAAGGPTGAATTWFKSPDGTLELGVPAHSVVLGAAGNAAAQGGAENRSTRQLGASSYVLVLQQTEGGFRGQSTQLAQLAFTVKDSLGHVVRGASLHAPLQLRLHYAPHELNGLNAASLRLSWPQTMDAAHHKAAMSVPVSVDATNHTLAATVSALSLSAGPMVVTATQSDANTASTEHITDDGNQGDASFTVPLDVPPAAGGLAPNLQLVYSSAGPNGRHSPTAPAPALGDGWDLSLGPIDSISYDTTTQLYYLNGGGVSEPLLCCMVDSKGNELFAPQHDPQVRVYTSNNSTKPAQENSDASCFHVEIPDGTVYDLGCTNDSRHATPSNSSFVATEWDVNHVMWLGNTSSGSLQQYNVTYWQDISTLNGTNFARDSFMGLIQYNYIGGNANARIYFNIHMPGPATPIGPAHSTQYGTNYNCASAPLFSTTNRCDVPTTPSGWEQAPYTMSTITVDDIYMQVWSSGAWHTVRQYHLSYNKDDPFGKCWDQFNGQNYACAGDHTLHSVQEIPYQIVNGVDTAMPSRQPITFGYTYFLTNEYHDTTELPTGNPNAPYDVQNHWRFLSSVYDQETGVNYSVAYETGYGNTHGVSSGSVTDPTTCETGNNCTGAHAWPDDRQWPQQLVKSIADNGTGTTMSYSYVLNTPCGSGCTQDSWIPPNGFNACGDHGLPPTNPNQPCLEGTFGTYYNEVFTGFAQVYQTNPDGSTTVTQYYAGDGWWTNDWDTGDRLLGRTVSTRLYAGAAGSSALLTETDDTGYSDITNDCPAVQSNGYQLYNNPYLMCMVFQTAQVTKEWEGAPSGATVPTKTESWSYHDGSTSPNHFYMQLNSAAVSGNNLLADSFANYGTSQPTFTTSYGYVWRDDANSGTPGYYLVNLQAQSTLSDSAGTQWSCTQTSYDGLGFETGSQTNLVDGLATRTDKFASGTCGDTATAVTTGSSYDTYGQTIATSDGDAIAGIAGHTSGCGPSAIILVGYSNGESSYTTCTDYDATTHAYVNRSGNALNQHTTATWDVVQGVQTASTDLNGIATTYAGPAYEYSGTPSLSTYQDSYVQVTLPGEAYGTPGIAQGQPWSARAYTYSFCAQATSGTLPCMETDVVGQFDGTNLAVERELYDRDGRLVETRTSGPTPGNDAVTITRYDDVNDKEFTSNACEVPALSASNGRLVMGSYYAPVLTSYAGGSAPSSYVDLNNPPSGSNCGGVTGTTTYSDALGRTVATDDALGTGTGTAGSGCLLGTTHHTTCTSYAAVVASSVAGLSSSDGEPYVRAVTVDANLHQSATYTDVNGQDAYEQRFTGASQTPLGNGIASYAVTSYKYDPAGTLRVITQPGGQTTTYTYDDLGRNTGLNDPDLGPWSFSYDPNGNLVHSQDPRATSVFIGYDGLNRQLWRNTSNSASGAYVSYTYDQGTNGVGYVSKEGFTGGTASDPLSGSYSYTYDQRGQMTSLTQTDTSNTAYTLHYAYNDTGEPTGLTYSDGEAMSLSYNATDWLSSVVTTTLGTTSTPLAGDTTVESTTDTVAANAADAYEFTARASGTANQISVHLDAASTAPEAQVGLYSNDSSSGQDEPGTLLSSATITTPVAGAWNSVTLPSVSVTAGQSYWIALMDPTGSSGLRDDIASGSSGANTGVSDGNAGSGLPGTWATTVQWGNLTLSAYVSQVSSGSATTLLSNIAYSGAAGLAGNITGASIGNSIYQYAANYDDDLRLTGVSIIKPGQPTTGLFSSQRGYDGAGNVTSVSTSLPAGTDNQVFCYDEQNRLVWAGATGTPSCGSSLTPGSLTAAQYTQSFAYDSLGRLTSGPLGPYSYGDSAHLHAATSIGLSGMGIVGGVSGPSGAAALLLGPTSAPPYTATYDAAGDMICRSTSTTPSASCSGSNNGGAQMSYDAERRLSQWQNAPSSPTQTADYLYDGEGNRVTQRTAVTTCTPTCSTQTTTTDYLAGGAEEVTDGGVTKYYAADGMLIGVNSGGTISYLASDGLGSVSVALDGSGHVTGAQLYAPYGGTRYSSGTMPTTKGFTGQRADALTGLDYYNARYYDPVAGQFTSGDSVLPGDGYDPWGLSRYAYVEGNPETQVDPSGHGACNLTPYQVLQIVLICLAFATNPDNPSDMPNVGPSSLTVVVRDMVSLPDSNDPFTNFLGRFGLLLHPDLVTGRRPWGADGDDDNPLAGIPSSGNPPQSGGDNGRGDGWGPVRGFGQGKHGQNHGRRRNTSRNKNKGSNPSRTGNTPRNGSGSSRRDFYARQRLVARNSGPGGYNGSGPLYPDYASVSRGITDGQPNGNPALPQTGYEPPFESGGGGDNFLR